MVYHALIPVKSLEFAKSRLNKYLSYEKRKKLVLHMLDHVITTVQNCKDIKQISIVTSDSTIMQHSQKHGVKIAVEEKQGLNPALYAAALHEKGEGVEGLVTISADLPLLTVSDIYQLLALAAHADVVLAPSKDKGTNALVTKPPLVIPYLFGKNSFEKYIQIAQKRNCTVSVYKSKTTAFDIDTVEDVEKLKKSINSYQFITG